MIPRRTSLGPLRTARERWKLRSRAEVGEGVQLLGRMWTYGGGRIMIGNRVVFDASRAPIELHVNEGAQLLIGDDVFIEGGSSIEAVESVQLGTGAFVGAWSKILDNHFHPLYGDRGLLPTSEPVVIGPRVRIGERCIVLPGTKLEEGVRLGPGVVIGRRVPAGLELEGSPPRRVVQ